jgi:hypothetical protein
MEGLRQQHEIDASLSKKAVEQAIAGSVRLCVVAPTVKLRLYDVISSDAHPVDL